MLPYIEDRLESWLQAHYFFEGFFLKSVCKGQLLSAMGLDANYQMMSIVWGIMDKENENNQHWFLSWLHQELALGDGSQLIIISDMQKVYFFFLTFILTFNYLMNMWCVLELCKSSQLYLCRG